MKKIFLVLFFIFIGLFAFAQTADDFMESSDVNEAIGEDGVVSDSVVETAPVEEIVEEEVEEVIEEEELGFWGGLTKMIEGTGVAKKFKQGGPVMYPMLLIFLFAVGIIIWRLIVLRLAKLDTKKFLSEITEIIRNDGVEAAEQFCASKRGTIAEIMHAGLRKADKGLDAVEKAIEDAAGIEMSYLEKGLVWLSLCVGTAPMLGFLGTVTGMIGAFEAIARAGTVEPTIVASGISEALITTASGLAAAIPLQIAYNYFLSAIDALVLEMQESTGEIIDTLIDLQAKK